MLDRTFFGTVAIVAIVTSFALPAYALGQRSWWWNKGRKISLHWSNVLGVVASAFATPSIAWRFVLPGLLHRHDLQSGSEDQAWWQLMGIRAGSLLSFAALTLGSSLTKGW